jgi:signal transduction histidine kinase
MRKPTLVFLILVLCMTVRAQQKVIDSLRKQIATAKDDTTRIMSMNKLGQAYVYSKPDSALQLEQRALQLSRSNKFPKGEEAALNLIGQVYDVTGNYPKALSNCLESLKIGGDIHDLRGMEVTLHNVSNIYGDMGDQKQSINYSLKGKGIAERAHIERSITVCQLNTGDSYEQLNMLDSALFYTRDAYLRAQKQMDRRLTAIASNNLGNDYLKMRQLDTALHYYRNAIPLEKATKMLIGFCETTLGIAKIYRAKGQADSSLYYARQSIAEGWRGGFTVKVLAASQFLSEYFEKQGMMDSAFRYQKVQIAAKDSLFSQEKTSAFQNLSFAERQRQQDIQEQKAAYRATIRYYLLIAVIVFLVIMAIVFWRNNKQNKKARTQIQHTLDELKITQNQLVQSAKMASLGELTAGIAHEIQNPLNFVNNFSEVNTELIEEMQDEISRGNYAEVKVISEDLKVNQQKISQHGKRADFIVKGMLEHSRTSTGERQVTNINVLADEFLKLSYHGLRAKDKSFNAELVTNFDPSLPKLNVVQQDIGRVLINLFGNAFYAVNQKAKTTDNGYKPIVEVSTVQQNGSILISVKDNGNGIPDAIKDKIMQPFFTTKPTGEGTGLGLSLSYDIVVKGHGGKIDVESKEGEGSEFTVTLPI